MESHWSNQELTSLGHQEDSAATTFYKSWKQWQEVAASLQEMKHTQTSLRRVCEPDAESGRDQSISCFYLLAPLQQRPVRAKIINASKFVCLAYAIILPLITRTSMRL